MDNIGVYEVSRPSLVSLLLSMIFSSGILLTSVIKNTNGKVLSYNKKLKQTELRIFM